MDITTKTNPFMLNDKWNLYFHYPHDTKWDFSSYKLIMENIDNVEKLIAINETVPEKVIKSYMLFLMRNWITPLWEDKNNRNGGCFSFKVSNPDVHLVWRSLIYAICGETLCINKQHNQFINGLSISPKRGFCIIKVWFIDKTLQDSTIFINIPKLQKNGCIFQEHKPEF